MKVTYIVPFYITFIFSQVDYESQILNFNCTFCHKAGGIATLNLTSHTGAISVGWSGPAIITGDHQNSLLYQRIFWAVFLPVEN